MKIFTSIFAQMLGIVNRGMFERAVREHQAEAESKGFSSWDQFVAMLFAQVGQADSLREISERNLVGREICRNLVGPRKTFA